MEFPDSLLLDEYKEDLERLKYIIIFLKYF